jgi:hypothetical protein
MRGLDPHFLQRLQRVELFDLRTDVGELTDLAMRQPKRARELQSKLRAGQAR